MFDSDLDFKKNRVRLWKPGTVAELAASEGLEEVPAAVLNESGGAAWWLSRRRVTRLAAAEPATLQRSNSMITTQLSHSRQTAPTAGSSVGRAVMRVVV